MHLLHAEPEAAHLVENPVGGLDRRPELGMLVCDPALEAFAVSPAADAVPGVQADRGRRREIRSIAARAAVAASALVILIVTTLALGWWPATRSLALPDPTRSLAPGPSELFVAVSNSIPIVDALERRILQSIPPPDGVDYTAYGSGTVSADGRYMVLTTVPAGIIVFDMVDRLRSMAPLAGASRAEGAFEQPKAQSPKPEKLANDAQIERRVGAGVELYDSQHGAATIVDHQ